MEASYAFSSDGLWRPSIFGQALEDDENNIFRSLQTSLKSSLLQDLGNNTILGADAFAFPPPEQDLSGLSSETGDRPDEVDDVLFDDLVDLKESLIVDDDLWDLSLANSENLQAESRLHTWEAFQHGKQQEQVPAYMSEAGPHIFDAYLQRQYMTEGVFPQDVMLRASCSLVLGRSSLFFRWNESKRSFQQTIQDVPVSGTSMLCSSSLISGLMHVGALFRKLSSVSAVVGAAECTTFVALRRCIATVLTGIEHHISDQTAGLRSLLQLQSVVERPAELLGILNELLVSLGKPRSDETVVAILSDHVTTIADTSSVFTAVFCMMLLEVCTPWLERIAEDVGLCRGIGANGTPVDLQDRPPNEDQLRQILTQEDAQLIRTTRNGFELLRQHVPSHPLALPQDATLDLHRLDINGTQHNDASLGSTSVIDLSLESRPVQSTASVLTANDLDTATGNVQHQASAQHAFELSDDIFLEMDELPTNSVVDQMGSYATLANGIKTTLSSAFDDDYEKQGVGPFTQVWDFDPLAALRPTLQTHARQVNHAVLSYVFETYKLCDHLQLHRAFHLFGNGNFVTRLTTALFSDDDVQTAERKRGTVPTAQTMGLRLGSREEQRWPPASSELRLTLMGLLNDTYSPGDAHGSTELPGGLSFAIRELSDEEIDKVMDTTSIHALDFVRLQYTPPEPLATIFTLDVVNKYDSIFRTLLMLVRMLHTTSRLARHCSNRNGVLTPVSPTVSSFAWQARHVVTVLTSHFTDVAISSAWSRFSADLDELDRAHSSQLRRSRVKMVSRTVGIDDVALLHETCLEDIRAKMFLRRKHEKVRQSIEAVFDTILKGAAVVLHRLNGEPDPRQHVRAFDQHYAELVKLLGAIAQKPAKETKIAGKSETESEVAKILIARLGWRQPGE